MYGIKQFLALARKLFMTKPARIREKMLDLATSSVAVEFCLHTTHCLANPMAILNLMGSRLSILNLRDV